MVNECPVFLDKHRICVVCEGDEENEYLNRLKELNVWNSQYEVQLDNAGGNGNIPARYQYQYQNDAYEIVLVFCDTDKKPYKQYEEIKKKINEFHGNDNAADAVIIYSNPCVLQIILEHWADVRLTVSAKKVNAPLIEELTGIKNYKARKDQRKELMQQITARNYQDMCLRIARTENDDTCVGSSNFGRFMEYLSSANAHWIEAINEVLEGDDS